MQPLRVTQLPFVRPEVESNSAVMEREGFVDEAVVKILVQQPSTGRPTARQSDLVLSAEDLDFAGWNFPAFSATREPQAQPVQQWVPQLTANMASPKPLSFTRAHPVTPEPSSRWWLAGLAGVVTTVVFSLILIKLISPLSFEVPPVMPEKPMPHSESLSAPAAAPRK